MPTRTTPSTIARRYATGLLALGGVLALAGCSGGYRANPTPELSSLSQTSPEVNNRMAVTIDTNFRSIWDDLGRFMLVDRPTTLVRPRTPY